MVHGRCNCYFSFWAISCPFTPLTAEKIKLFKKMKKKPLEISSFYTCVPKIMIRWCKVPEKWCAMDGRTDGRKWHIELGPPPKNTWRYYYFMQVYQKLWSYAILFLRYHRFCLGGELIWKFAQILWEQNFFLNLWGDKPLWGELKVYGGSNIYYYTFIISFIQKQKQPAPRTHLLADILKFIKSPLAKLHFLCLLRHLLRKKVFC